MASTSSSEVGTNFIYLIMSAGFILNPHVTSSHHGPLAKSIFTSPVSLGSFPWKSWSTYNNRRRNRYAISPPSMPYKYCRDKTDSHNSKTFIPGGKRVQATVVIDKAGRPPLPRPTTHSIQPLKRSHYATYHT
jgi:hypothetical protein